MEADFRAGGIGYGDFKKRLFERDLGVFPPDAGSAARNWRRTRHPWIALVKCGRRTRAAVALRTMARVRAAVGLR